MRMAGGSLMGKRMRRRGAARKKPPKNYGPRAGGAPKPSGPTDEPPPKRKLVVPTPEWLVPLLKPARYKGAHGGRGSGKSHGFATMMILAHLKNPNTSSVCIREVQKSLKYSVKSLLEGKIKKLNLTKYFHITNTEIRSKRGTGVIIFEGMNDHTAESLKSLEGFDRAWVEEAQTFSEKSLEMLTPTIRNDGSEIWFTWNPKHKTDPVDVFLRGEHPPPDSIVLEVNYKDNPWFPSHMAADVQHCLLKSRKKYDHIWMGKYIEHAEARFFDNWKVEHFETPKSAQVRLGLDWGFDDPLALVGCYIELDDGKRKLYVDREAYKTKCTIRETSGVLLQVPGANRLQITAGADRPERILDLNEKGFKCVKAVRGPNSVIHGYEWLADFDEIIVHPDCKNTADEFELACHPVDKLTQKVLSGIVDDDLHCLEALRYACEAVRKLEKTKDHSGITYLPVDNNWNARSARNAH